MRKLSLIAAAAAASAFATNAQAADLGGNCCADLEERIAELEATTARKGNRKVSLTVSGFINEAVMFWDNGGESNVYEVTNPYAPSRFRFTGEAKINEEWKAGYYLEIQSTSAAGSGVTTSNDDAGFGISLRQSNWFITSSRLGTIRVGQASPATDDIILGSPANINHAQSNDELMGDAIAFFSPATGLTGITPGSLAPGLDTARRNIIRYDTPTFQGFRIAAAWGEDDFWDVGLWMANTWRDFKVVFNMGYLEDTEGNGLSSVFSLNANGFCCQGANFSEFKGSAGVMYVPVGLFADGAWVHREFDRSPITGAQLDDFDYWTVRAGLVRKDLMPLGETTFWGFYENAQGAGVTVGTNDSREMDVWGFGVNQAIPAAAMDLYLVYKNFEADVVTGGVAQSLDDIDIVYTGAIIRF